MKRLVAFLVLVLGVCAGPARAALVYDANYYPTTGPGGLSTPYPGGTPDVYAGLLEMVYNGSPVLVMSDDHATRANVGESWAMHLYSYAEVLAGAPVRFTPAQYARAWYLLSSTFPGNLYNPSFSLRQLAEAAGNTWLASANIQVWEIMSSSSCSLTIFTNGCSGVDDLNWSTQMAVASGGPGRDEYLIPLVSQNLTLGPVVPLPPAFWLLGSGLLGLVGVARKKYKAPH